MFYVITIVAIVVVVRADFVYRTFNETDGIRVSVNTLIQHYKHSHVDPPYHLV